MQNQISKFSFVAQFCFILLLLEKCFGLVLETHMNLRVAEPDFLDEKKLTQK